MSKKKILEREIEEYLVQRVEDLGGVCLKLEVAGRTGWPDRLCVMPYGDTWFIEVKRPDGVLAPIQIARLETLLELGHRRAVVWNKQMIDDIIPRFLMDAACRRKSL